MLRVDNPHHQLVVARAQRLIEQQLERQVAALVLADQLPVEPDPRDVVDRAEVQDVGRVRGIVVIVARSPITQSL